jgi:hypothetical protein
MDVSSAILSVFSSTSARPGNDDAISGALLKYRPSS